MSRRKNKEITLGPFKLIKTYQGNLIFKLMNENAGILSLNGFKILLQEFAHTLSNPLSYDEVKLLEYDLTATLKPKNGSVYLEILRLSKEKWETCIESLENLFSFFKIEIKNLNLPNTIWSSIGGDREIVTVNNHAFIFVKKGESLSLINEICQCASEGDFNLFDHAMETWDKVVTIVKKWHKEGISFFFNQLNKSIYTNFASVIPQRLAVLEKEGIKVIG
jgi:hypothetical protein